MEVQVVNEEARQKLKDRILVLESENEKFHLEASALETEVNSRTAEITTQNALLETKEAEITLEFRKQAEQQEAHLKSKVRQLIIIMYSVFDPIVSRWTIMNV